MKYRLIFVIALLLPSLSGCGIISIGYDYADAYLRYSINSYASFNGEQKEFIKKEVNDFMRWHRKNMLPEYVSLLQELHKIVQSGTALKKEDVTRFRGKVRMLYVKTMQPAIKPAAHLLSDIAPGQVEELVKSFQRENRKKKGRELSGNPDEQLRKRAERAIDSIENLVGGFSDRQLDLIREMSHKLPIATGIYFQVREDNQARLIELIKNKKGVEEIGGFLLLWLTAPEAGRSVEEQRMLLAFEQASDDMVVQIYRLLTERQRKTLLGNITKYIASFQKLSQS